MRRRNVLEKFVLPQNHSNYLILELAHNFRNGMVADLDKDPWSPHRHPNYLILELAHRYRNTEQL
jgi:hypothetical protein